MAKPTVGIAIQDEFNEFLWSVKLGRYYNISSDLSQHLIVQECSYTENGTPSANEIAMMRSQL
ncbi:MAG: hypothetical protein V7K27_04055 [Nostoc sp.]|uniref:hypothetical protein n=1 Tax=Nostoc sp. TaxID=1180 RepID=UPI002FFC3908